MTAMIFDKNGLQIKYRLLWKGNAWAAQAVFINVTPVPFTNLTFQVAVPKVRTDFVLVNIFVLAYLIAFQLVDDAKHGTCVGHRCASAESVSGYPRDADC